MAASLKDLARELSLLLLERQWQPQQLRPSQAVSLQLLRRQCLEEAISLREAGQAELGVLLLNQVEAAGLQTPELIAEKAQILELLENRLVAALSQRCAEEHWQPKHLQDLSSGSVLERVRQEQTATRNAQQAGLSFALGEITLAEGWIDPWVLENQALALVELRREEEALPIFQTLESQSDPDLAETARTNAALIQRRLAHLQREEQAQALLAQGESEQAQAVLLQILLEDPGFIGIRRQLGELLDQGASGEGDGLLASELAPVQAKLRVHERLIELMEQRLASAPPWPAC
jgi:tetratricopeptide (TPR) repeat protein